MEVDKLWEILVPTIRKDGKPFRTRFHRVWDDKVRKFSTGATILKPVKGKWVNPAGDLFIERMIPVRICCSEKAIEDIADMTAKHYEQEAVMFWKISDDVRIKHYKE